jgi:hypothetical protein
VLQTHCSSCHLGGNNQGGINFDKYAQVKHLVDTGLLLGAIRWDPGSKKMPFGGLKIPDCDIKIIEKWKATGYTDTCALSNVTFSGTILPLLDQYCGKCHLNGETQGNLSLDLYEDVKKKMVDGSLLGSIQWKGNYKRMPDKAPRMAICDIKTFEKWYADGMPNN